ncbi:FAD-dependent oxidoreductase [Microbispora sp. CA-135349]|uniref:FAD-dependent oxidoreductase n=1 Tax=Microbispora sp. CA-135349 TaxID=3239953 RepID=UPI003D8A4479
MSRPPGEHQGRDTAQRHGAKTGRSDHVRCTVVWAGAWGLSAAAELAARGHRVTLVERHGIGGLLPGAPARVSRRHRPGSDRPRAGEPPRRLIVRVPAKGVRRVKRAVPGPPPGEPGTGSVTSCRACARCARPARAGGTPSPSPARRLPAQGSRRRWPRCSRWSSPWPHVPRAAQRAR